MALTVADVLKLPPLDRCQICAGAQGLQRSVTGASVLETPSILDVLKGGELVLTTGFVVREQPELLLELLKGIHARGSAGMVIQTSRWLRAVPESVKAFAEAVGFPLLILPEEHAWLDLINPIMSRIFAERHQDDFLLDLLFGNFRTEEELLSRGRLYGFQFSGPKQVAVLALSGDQPEQAPARERWLPVLRSHLRAAPQAAVCVPLQDVVALLVDAGDAPDGGGALALVQALRPALSYAVPGCVVSAGIGTPARHPLELARSFAEARQALAVGRLLWGAGRTFYFDDIGIFRLLLSGCTAEQLLSFKEHTIGELEQHDARTGGALCDTLEVFLDLDNSVSQTATAMYLHPNTVQYRLKQIRKILRLRPDANSARLTLHVALKIRRLQRQGSLLEGGPGAAP